MKSRPAVAAAARHNGQAMLGLSPDASRSTPYKVLCLGAHADDVEIGCGGTILQMIANRPLEVRWVVLSANPVREREAQASAARFLKGARRATVTVQRFRESFFPHVGGEIKEFFEGLRAEFSPDLIFTHCRHDLHQDHRVTCELTWNTFRHHLILEYEVPKYDGDLGAPNCFVALDAATCRRKVRHLLSGFPSQRDKHWFTEETFRALMRLRGIECAAPGHYAEAFYGRKLTLDW
jgi:LmbE family N-acetylglucosaminyl deacetylase